MSESYKDYQGYVIDDIETCLDNLGCQPILFIGSGFSRRYMGAPTWDDLLASMASLCPNITKDYGYYKQSFKDPVYIGSQFVEPFKEWAWAEKKNFPTELFDPKYSADIYLKFKVTEFISAITPTNCGVVSDKNLQTELSALKAINPHAIITTNYDKLLEIIFEDYTPVIGQKILKSSTFSVGEIFKIHGCVSEPNSIVLTESDYENFMAKKKYLSAKLLTFFAEHPLVFIGYSASDPNILNILSDIDEIISEESDIIPNIYLLQWQSNVEETGYPQREQVLMLNDKRQVRIKCIVASHFDWVFSAFANNKPLESIHPKLLRALLSRTYDLVRCDIPRKKVEVDFETLEHALGSEGELGKIFGITSIGDATKVNAQFPLSLTNVAKQIGYSSWHYANQLLEKLRLDTGIDIKQNDNKYHIAIKAGDVVVTRKYSQETVALLQQLKNGGHVVPML